MTNQTVITQYETVYGVTITSISYKGFWTYGVYNGSVVRMYEGWNSWEVVR